MYVPGINAIVSLVLILALGFVVSSVVSQRISRYFSQLLLRIPVFRGVYGAVKRLVEAILLEQRGIYGEGKEGSPALRFERGQHRPAHPSPGRSTRQEAADFDVCLQGAE